MALDPDLVLVDLLMPGRDGIQLVQELKELGSQGQVRDNLPGVGQRADCKSVSGGSGVLYPEAHQPDRGAPGEEVGNVIRQMENEGPPHHQSVFQSQGPQPAARQKVWRRHQYILGQLGMAGEKGPGTSWSCASSCWSEKQTASQIRVGTLCSQLSDSPKTMEQRVRRAVGRAGPYRQPGGGGLWERVLHPVCRGALPFPGGAG